MAHMYLWMILSLENFLAVRAQEKLLKTGMYLLDIYISLDMES